MNIDILHSIHEIDAGAWDAVLGPHDINHSHAYAAAMESARLDSCTFRYVVARDVAGKVIAHANICSVATPLDLFLPRRSRTSRLLQALRRRWPRFLVSQIVECGSPVALGRPMACSPLLTDSQRRELAEAVHAAMRALARDTGADLLVVRDFTGEGDEDAMWQSFVGAGYVAAPNLEEAVLDMRWPSFASYLDGMKAKYRNELRQQQRKAERAGIRREVVVDFASHAVRLAELWQAVSDRADTQLRERLGPDYFVSMSRHLGERSFVTLFWRGDTIVAFTLYVANGDVLVPLYIGIDYALNAEASLVFNAYQDWVEMALARGHRRIEMGLTAYEPKMRLGAHLARLRVLVRHRLGWLTAPTAWFYRWMTPQQSVTSRNVFHAQPKQDAAPAMRAAA